MKKEKNMLQDKFSAGEYLAPKIKVKEIRVRRVLCASDPTFSNGINSLEEDTGEEI